MLASALSTGGSTPSLPLAGRVAPLAAQRRSRAGVGGAACTRLATAMPVALLPATPALADPIAFMRTHPTGEIDIGTCVSGTLIDAIEALP